MCASTSLRSYKALAFDSKNGVQVSITECRSCRFAWQYPFARSEDDSARFFDAAYSDAGRTQSEYFDPEYKKSIARLQLDFIAGLPVAGRRLLDIGAGAGIFAEVAADAGWIVTAVDPALDIDRLGANPRINPIRGKLEDIAEAESFDVISLWDVIEHTTTPVELVESAKRYIAKGGWLVVETGNFKSIDRICGGLKHWMYQLDHRWYFSPQSMRQLLKEAGFTDLVFAQALLRPGWRGAAEYPGPSRWRLLRSVLRRPWRIHAHLAQHRELIEAKSWDLAGIGIFAVAASKA
jgi:2-polyprenyl-3-methyl-5-hydroxy-6-metoxy-1,4-benzoquinol methylase